MSTSPNRERITTDYNYYPASTNSHYRDAFYIRAYRLFRQAQFLHTTTTVDEYDTLTIKYKPNGALSAASSNNEISLRLAVDIRYHSDDNAGVKAIYTADNKPFYSGSQYSGVVLNPNNNEVFSVHYGQPSIDNSPLRFTLARQSAYSDNTEYTWIIPLIKNPSTAYISLRYNLTLVHSPSSEYEHIFNHYESLN